MQRFIHNENLKRFHELLAQENDPAKREQIERLVKEEEARVIDPPPDPNSKH
jgi:hypothetical protein